MENAIVLGLGIVVFAGVVWASRKLGHDDTRPRPKSGGRGTGPFDGEL